MSDLIKKYFIDLANGDSDKYNELLKICKDIIQNTLDKPIIIFKGDGNNGKSVLVRLLTILIGEIAGPHSIKNVSSEILKKPQLWYSNDLHYVILSEVNNTSLNNLTKTLKEYTSGNKIYYKNKTYTLNLKFIIMTNDNINIIDNGFNNRVKIIDMTTIFNNGNGDNNILHKLLQHTEEIKQFINNYNNYDDQSNDDNTQNDDLDDNFDDVIRIKISI